MHKLERYARQKESDFESVLIKAINSFNSGKMTEISPDQAKELLIEIVNNQKTVRITRLKPLVETLNIHITNLERENKNYKKRNRKQYKKIKRQQSALARLNEEG